MTDFRKLIEDPNGPVQFGLQTPVGAVLEETPPYPRIVVTDTHVLYVRRLVWHTIDIDARAGDAGKSERLTVGRLVAEIEGGGEIEMQRTVIPTDALNQRPIDANTCAACGYVIPDSDAVIIDDAAYHRGCVEEV